MGRSPFPRSLVAAPRTLPVTGLLGAPLPAQPSRALPRGLPPPRTTWMLSWSCVSHASSQLISRPTTLAYPSTQTADANRRKGTPPTRARKMLCTVRVHWDLSERIFHAHGFNKSSRFIPDDSPQPQCPLKKPCITPASALARMSSPSVVELPNRPPFLCWKVVSWIILISWRFSTTPTGETRCPGTCSARLVGKSIALPPPRPPQLFRTLCR